MSARQKRQMRFEAAIWDLLRSALDAPHIPEKTLLVYTRLLSTGVYSGIGLGMREGYWCRELRILQDEFHVFIEDMEARGYLHADFDDDTDLWTIFPGMREDRKLLE